MPSPIGCLYQMRTPVGQTLSPRTINGCGWPAISEFTTRAPIAYNFPPKTSSKDATAWIHQMPPTTRNASTKPNTVSGLSSKLLRSTFRRTFSTPAAPPIRRVSWSSHVEVRQLAAPPIRRVSWSSHVEVRQLASPSVTWNTRCEVFIIPARERAPD